MDKYAVIMAGGVGSRFWPRSRKTLPKQLLNLFGEFTMIQETVNRLNGFIDTDKIFVITNKVQKALIEEQLPQIPKNNIVLLLVKLMMKQLLLLFLPIILLSMRKNLGNRYKLRRNLLISPKGL